MAKRLVIGLTGGVASGKSTVAGMLAAAGLPVIDTDALGHALLADPASAAHQAVVARFGPDIVDSDGGVRRQALAGQVFGDEEARRALEAILHPAIADEVWRQVERLPDDVRVVVLEVPLLFEVGWDAQVDRTVVVDCDPEEQARRFSARTGATTDEAHARIAAQMDRGAKRRRADFVVDNTGTRDALAGEVRRLIAWLEAEAE